jgi:hypothetical protein
LRTEFGHTPCPVKAEVLVALASAVLEALLSPALSGKVMPNSLCTSNYITLDKEIPLDLIKVKVRLLCKKLNNKLYWRKWLCTTRYSSDYLPQGTKVRRYGGFGY